MPLFRVGKTRRLALACAVLLFLSGEKSQAQSSQVEPAAHWVTGSDGRRSLTLRDPAGNSQLVVPPVCQQRPCSLVIVSHGRGGQASDGSTHRPFDAMLDTLDVQGFVLLLSSDGGRETWGSPAALAAITRAYHAALPRFQHDGRVYTLGISMGGLPATLTAYQRTLGIEVKAVALVAGRVNLQDAVKTSRGRAGSVTAAYRSAPLQGHDPVNDFVQFVGRFTPLLVVSSPQDRTVRGDKNGLRLAHLARAAGASVQVIQVTGPHLNRRMVNAQVGRQIGAFFRAHH